LESFEGTFFLHSKLALPFAGQYLAEEDKPSGFFKLLTAGISDFFIGGSHLRRVDLATTELILDGVKTFCCQPELLAWKSEHYKLTFVNVILLAVRGASASTRARA
jgi:hypothetical protein